jgi:hypothetical protein
MANSVLSIVIKLAKEGNADKDTITSLQGVASTVGGVIGVFGALAAAGVAVDQVLKNTIGTYVDYGNKVKDVMEMTGMTAEESSRLTVIAGDLGLSVQNLAMGFKTMAKNGIDPTINGMIQLVEQYQELPNQIDKDTFAVKNFGRSWEAFEPILSMSVDDIRKLADEVPLPLIFDSGQANQARDLQISLNQVQDDWNALLVSLALPAMQELLGLINAFNDLNRSLYAAYPISTDVSNSIEKFRDPTQGLTGDMGGLTLSTNKWTIASGATQAVLAELAQKTYGLTAVVGNWDDMLKQAQAGVEAYDKSQGNLLDDGMKLTTQTEDYQTKLADLNTQLAAAETKYKDNSTQVKDLKSQIQDLEDTQKRQTDEFVLDMMKQAGIAPEAQIAYARAAGLISDAAATEATAILGADKAMQKAGLSSDQMADVNAKVTAALALGGKGADTFFTQLQDLDKQLANGTLSSQDYYHALDQIYLDLLHLSGMDAVAHLTVITTYIGGTPPTPGELGSGGGSLGNGTGSGGFTGKGGKTTSVAIGGSVSAGETYYVHRDEIFVPGQNGYVLSRRDANQIAGSVTNSNNNTRKSLNIYGSVTYVIPDMGTDWLNEIV